MKLKNIFFVQIILLHIIIITGGLVRLTQSGLGCSTWPMCTENSLTPISQSIHQYIEFGNRSFTIILLAYSVLLLILTLKLSKNKTIKQLAIMQPIGIIIQAVIGGISVLTHLNPFVVSIHFVVTIIFISLATTLYIKETQHINKIKTINTLFKIYLIIFMIHIYIGSLLASTGSYTGDNNVHYAFNHNPIIIIHILFAIILTILIIFIYQNNKNLYTKRLKYLFILQLILGYTQYITHFNISIILMHMINVGLIAYNTTQAKYQLYYS